MATKNNPKVKMDVAIGSAVAVQIGAIALETALKLKQILELGPDVQANITSLRGNQAFGDSVVVERQLRVPHVDVLPAAWRLAAAHAVRAACEKRCQCQKQHGIDTRSYKSGTNKFMPFLETPFDIDPVLQSLQSIAHSRGRPWSTSVVGPQNFE